MVPDNSERFFGIESLWRDLRSGRAGFGVRMILSASSLGICVSAMLLMLGLLQNNRVSVRDEEVFVGFAAATAAWMACLYAIWSTFPRWRRALRTGFVCIGVIVATIGICILFGAAMRRPEFFIAATIFGGIATTLTVLASAVYQSSKGRKILDSAGNVSVSCPGCGYSMSGLDSCACPECGARYALDELIRLQGYEALAHNRAVPSESHGAPEIQSTLEPQALLGPAAS